MTDKEQACRRYRQALCVVCDLPIGRRFGVAYSAMLSERMLSSWCRTEAGAWRAARQRLAHRENSREGW